MALNDVYHVKAVFLDNVTGKENSTSFNGRQNDPIAPDISAIGPDVVDWWNVDLAGAGSAYKSFCENALQLVRVTMRRIDPLEAVESIYTTGLPIAGTGTDDPAPAGSAVCASLRTASIGRRYRGRMFLPRVTEDHIDPSGNLSSADALLVANQLMTMFNTCVVDRLTPIVYSPQDLAADPPRPGTFKTDITLVRVDRLIRTQRKRQVRRPLYVNDSV